MNSTTLALIIHAVVGLAVIAAVAVLGAIGTITGTQALDVIGIITSLLLGGGAVAVGSTINATPTPPVAPTSSASPVSVSSNPLPTFPAA